MKKYTLADIDKLVEKNVKHYKSDWYEHDRPRSEKDSHFVISLRDTGVDCMYLGAEKGWNNLDWSRACFDSERAKAIYEYNNGTLKKIDHEKAQKILKEAIETCPEGYVEECKKLHPMYDFIPTVEQYKEYVKEMNDNIHHGYAWENLADWTKAQDMPY